MIIFELVAYYQTNYNNDDDEWKNVGKDFFILLLLYIIFGGIWSNWIESAFDVNDFSSFQLPHPKKCDVKHVVISWNIQVENKRLTNYDQSILFPYKF